MPLLLLDEPFYGDADLYGFTPAVNAPEKPLDFWSWRAASRARRTLLLLSALYAPRTGLAVALSYGDPTALSVLLSGATGDAAVASATLRCVISWALLPRLALATLAWRARHGPNPWIAGSVALFALTRGTVDLLCLKGNSEAVTGEEAMERAVCATALRIGGLALSSLFLPWLPDFLSDLLLLIAGISLPLWRLMDDAEPWVRAMRAAVRSHLAARAMRRRQMELDNAVRALHNINAVHDMLMAMYDTYDESEDEEENDADENDGSWRGGHTAQLLPPARAAPPTPTPAPVRFPPPLQLPTCADADPSFPSHLRCPVTMCAMTEPVLTPAGITYERGALMQWVRAHGTEPITRQHMTAAHILPNLCARAAIEEWCAANKAGTTQRRSVRARKAATGAFMSAFPAPPIAAAFTAPPAVFAPGAGAFAGAPEPRVRADVADGAAACALPPPGAPPVATASGVWVFRAGEDERRAN